MLQDAFMAGDPDSVQGVRTEGLGTELPIGLEKNVLSFSLRLAVWKLAGEAIHGIEVNHILLSVN